MQTAWTGLSYHPPVIENFQLGQCPTWTTWTGCPNLLTSPPPQLDKKNLTWISSNWSLGGLGQVLSCWCTLPAADSPLESPVCVLFGVQTCVVQKCSSFRLPLHHFFERGWDETVSHQSGCQRSSQVYRGLLSFVDQSKSWNEHIELLVLPDKQYFEVIVEEVSDNGAGPTIGIASCSALFPSPTCPLERDHFRWHPDGERE